MAEGIRETCVASSLTRCIGENPRIRSLNQFGFELSPQLLKCLPVSRISGDVTKLIRIFSQIIEFFRARTPKHKPGIIPDGRVGSMQAEELLRWRGINIEAESTRLSRPRL